MNPDHADHDTNDMPRAVEHALRAHNAMDDELCRTVAGEVWQDMQQAYDDIYGMWREEMRAAREELERERDLLRAAIDDAEHAEDCQCLIRAKGGTKYDAAWCDCWLAKIYAIDAARKGEI